VADAPLVARFDELGLANVDLVGGKSANLGELTGAGFPVPAGFAVTTAAYEGAHPVPGELPVITPALADAVASAYAQLGTNDPPVAVRSSAVAEDTAEASFAGVQDTYLWLRGVDAVLDGIQRCWRSYWNPEAVAYRSAHHVAAGAMSVAVQSMVAARVAGVMFTLNPVTGDPSTVAVEASWGLGVVVVGGEVTPDAFLVSKVTREVVRTELGPKEIEVVAAPDGRGTVRRDVDEARRARPCLSESELLRLVELARAVERHYGAHQDLEWAIDEHGELALLQARPETVWSGRAGARRRPGSLAEAPNAFASVLTRRTRP
jgi:pyruvate,water dikinase